MKPLFRLFVVIAIAAPVQFVFAGDGSKTPAKSHFSNQQLVAFINTDGYTAVMNTIDNVKGKVCACQILSVSSNNEKLDYVAVFAEKTNNGNLNLEYSTAMSVLEKQKKQIKTVFYPKMKTIQKITAYTSCDLLSARLKSANMKIDLKVYEIYNADILSNENIELAKK